MSEHRSGTAVLAATVTAGPPTAPPEEPNAPTGVTPGTGVLVPGVVLDVDEVGVHVGVSVRYLHTYVDGVEEVRARSVHVIIDPESLALASDDEEGQR